VDTLNSSRITRRSLALVTAIGSIFGAATPIAAQDQASTPRTSGVIDQVIVTATRREESLQNVPLAVSAVTAESLEARNVTNLADLSAGSIPSTVFTQFSGGTGTLAISVRGVGLSDPTQGTTELTVPVYIDGIFLGRAQGLGLDLIEPERVEILRGPQGQLFGRNAEGGVVQYVSRKPSGEFDLKGSVSYGDYDDQRYKLSVDLPKVAGFSTQLSGIYHKHDPYTEMSEVSRYPGGAAPPGPNHGHLELDTKGVRGAVRWQNEGAFTADYSYDYSDSFQTEGYLTWLDVDVVRPAFSLQAPGDDFLDTTNQRLFNLGFDVETSGHNLTLAWDVSDAVTLKSLTAYREASRHGGNDLGAALVGGGSSTGLVYTWSREDLDQDQTSQEFQFIGSWERFDLTAGAIYFNEQIDDGRTSNVTGPGLTAPALGLAPGLVFFGCVGRDFCPTTNTVSESETDSYGVYAQANWRPAVFDNKLELTTGLRYTDDKKEATRLFNNVGPFPVPADFDTTRVDPAASIKYQWTESLQTYVRYATGYRAGGANVRSSQFTSFDEEENEAWELGLKSQVFDGRLQMNFALFHTTVKGEQLNIQEQPTTNPSLTDTVNATNDKKVKGVEAELFWAATDDLNLGLNFSYMDRDDWVELDNPFTTVTDITRFYTVSTPETSGSVYLDYNRALGVGRFGFHADYAYARDYWTTPGALQLVTLLPTYERPKAETNQLNARLSWGDIELGGGQVTFAVWGKNLTDDSSYAYGFDGCASGGGFCAFRVAPRTYGLEMKFDF
jgi:iron complex outermembrane receptor protein